MQNRAKCRQCQSIIVSYHSTDLVYCTCGRIYVEGGEAMKCGADNWNNFLRVDDEGNEIEVRVKEAQDSADLVTRKASKDELLNNIRALTERLKLFPPEALEMSLNHHDYLSLLETLSAILELS